MATSLVENGYKLPHVIPSVALHIAQIQIAKTKAPIPTILLKAHPEYSIDKSVDYQLLVSVAPDGYLRKR
jgi:hypothetical protein